MAHGAARGGKPRGPRWTELSAPIRGRDAGRRDRLLLLAAIAHALLTLLGAASEKTGVDAYLKVNTAKKRTHSLFRQGAYGYDAIPNMRDDWLEILVKAFDEIASEDAIFGVVYALI